ncbi:MAG: YdcF family protein [Armatimonadetes bacterium]|nr:YdcF family protein [Armatimonadota bacterium]
MRISERVRPILRRAGMLAVAVGLLVGLPVAWMVLAVPPDEGTRADCVVVPGAKVHEDGRPAHVLAARVAHAVALLKEGRAHGVIFTGGQGVTGPVESEAARDYAITLGAPADRLFVETRSHTTYGNFYHAREVMRARGWTSCLVSTDPFHVRRCLMICQDLGIAGYPAPVFEGPAYTWPRLRAWYSLRECAATVKHLVRYRIMGNTTPDA